ncbi:hypothetical protein T439DRAFT_322312 [Meredithblackwellia eburnea MCA 4105]
MDFINKAKDSEFMGFKRAFGGGKHSTVGADGITTTPGGGLGNTGRPTISRRVWDDEDGSSALNIILRGLQTFLPFVNLCIYISIASFQAKWGVGPSFLTGLSLFFNAQSLLHGFLFLGTPLLYEKFLFLRGIARGLRQVRIGVIVNASQTLFMLLMALVTTISANSGGCKNPDSDPNKDKEGYTDAMPGFCRNKRAGAAFFWLNFFAWATTLALILYTWYKIRTNPQSTGFAIPGAQFPQDDEEAFAPSDVETGSLEGGRAGGVREQGYRPSGDYYGEGERGLFSESAPGYSAASYGADESDYHPQATDPFADQQRYGGDEPDADPYAAIRKSMEVSRVPQY